MVATIIVVGISIYLINKMDKDVSEHTTVLNKLTGFINEIVKNIQYMQNARNLKKLYYYSSAGDLNRAHPTDAGMDITSAENYVLKPNERHLFATGIFGILPKGTTVIVKPRSGLAVKYGINVLAGVVDEGYTGHIQVLLINHGIEDFDVKIGDKIAQLLLMDVYQTQPEKVAESLYETFKTSKDRGENGFGSSDKKVD